MYKIGEFSKIVNIPVRTLRYYAEYGVLVPSETDKYTGYKYYSDANVEEAIQNMRKAVVDDAIKKSDKEILESIGEKVNKVTGLVINNLNKQRDLETTIKRLRDENKELRNQLILQRECKHESSRILDPTIDIEISMKVNILKSDFDEYKKLEHHIERFVDMDSWKPNEVYDVKVNEVFKNKEDV